MRLTRNIPAIVREACEQLRGQHLTIPVVCPRLVPVSNYARLPGLWGAEVFRPTLYALDFNNGGDAACAAVKKKGCIHWLVGVGTASSVRAIVLSDRNNVNKGLPRLVASKTIAGRRLIDYRFPPYPAGGENGGHGAAFVLCGRDIVYASIHGYRTIAAAEQVALNLAQAANCPKLSG